MTLYIVISAIAYAMRRNLRRPIGIVLAAQGSAPTNTPSFHACAAHLWRKAAQRRKADDTKGQAALPGVTKGCLVSTFLSGYSK